MVVGRIKSEVNSTPTSLSYIVDAQDMDDVAKVLSQDSLKDKQRAQLILQMTLKINEFLLL